ncbi:MAG: prephenate dehydrogenase/arogenate dehydrogenase family protein [Candidatus Melainabacteria bacterium]|nr:prephenate dehydrogenase/arogenate dehydrogenase family protein [Candidatus Melainabacteria bacterium]
MTQQLKIGIVGLGLIGGSIEKRLALKSEQYELLCVSRSQGKEYSLEDLASTDIVFLCGEQSTIPGQLEEIAQIISKSGQEGSVDASERAFAKTIITDCASTKELISSRAHELGLENFIPGHPMAGTEKQGYEASFPELFEGAKWILANRNDKLEQVIAELGAQLVLLDPETHDRAVAVTSHLPLVLSIALANLSNSYSPSQSTRGPGYASMTRLAGGNAKLGREMISLNRANIKDSWQVFKDEVDALLNIYGEELEAEIAMTASQ